MCEDASTKKNSALAGADPSDPADPIDPSHKGELTSPTGWRRMLTEYTIGPVMAYM